MSGINPKQKEEYSNNIEQRRKELDEFEERVQDSISIMEGKEKRYQQQKLEETYKQEAASKKIDELKDKIQSLKTKQINLKNNKKENQDIIDTMNPDIATIDFTQETRLELENSEEKRQERAQFIALFNKNLFLGRDLEEVEYNILYTTKELAEYERQETLHKLIIEKNDECILESTYALSNLKETQLSIQSMRDTLNSEQKKNEENRTFQQKVKYIADRIVNNDIETAITKLNELDDKDFKDDRGILVNTFSKEFFELHADTMANFLSGYGNLESLLDTAWFKALTLIPQMVAALVKAKDASESKVFHETAEVFNHILTLRKTAHAFGSFVPTCQYKDQEFSLESSYFDTFEPALKDSSKQTEHTPDIRSYSVTTNFVESSGLHLSALTLCNSPAGRFIAIGNVGGGAEYIGINVYELKEDNQNSLTDVIEKIKHSQNNPIPHAEYLRMLEPLKGELVVKIPVMEQLHGYCGLKSCSELNHFSQLFFKQILDNKHPIHDLDEQTLNEMVTVTKKIHVDVMNQVRETIGTEMLAALKQPEGALITLKPEFFQDLYAQAKRYGLSKHFINSLAEYMQSKNIPLDFPMECYQNYVHERYGQGALNVEHTEKKNAIIDEFHQLNNDYDEVALSKLRTMDDALFEIEATEDNRRYILTGYEQITAYTGKFLPPSIETAELHNGPEFSVARFYP